MKIMIAFICTHNACRSQMAEGFAKVLIPDDWEVYSAGTQIAEKVNANAVSVMKEKGIDISSQQPKLLENIPREVDYLITMGCDVVCPFLPHKHEEDWGLEDPSGKSLDVFRKVRDEIEEKINDFLDRIFSQGRNA